MVQTKGGFMLSILKENILNTKEQMITYAEFIQFALYDPEWGYYMKEKEKIGKQGDFITTSHVSHFYGKLMAKWFLEQVKEKSLAPVVCELGGGNGRFAYSFMKEWERLGNPPLTYYIVEGSPYHQKLQREILSFNQHIMQKMSLEEVPPFSGLLFSNEFFDALPVHVIEKNNGKLFEVMITVQNNRLAEKRVPLENKNIQQFLQESNITLKEGQRIEIPLQMEKVIKQIANKLQQGIVVTVDYGYTDDEWQNPIYKDGSLRGYYKHQQINDCLVNVGEMDITSHVHFDSFIRMGEKYGLAFVGKWRQDQFLMENGILNELEDTFDPDPFSETNRRNRAIKSLILPTGISAYFHVIIQEKKF